ncbi:hypothetical protein [Saccharothrix sp. ST-888]|uniref:hypothetical protein n=1 Tax=Saccharothrix sp. ST-888 TaxID=1427391 RepID=UPI0005ECD03C|nr:hypothetical protein [Saccharothrix sp. ST-888]KJK58005.1 hypothetical protein UK12_13135 [Saccharothrix sp. ST-888]
MSKPLSVRRVLGAGPFAEMGEPSVAVRCEARGLVAVGGQLGHLHWPGWSVDGFRGHRVGVYGLGELDCRHLLDSRWPVNSIAFHPSLPLLAVGTGDYDGGYCFEGELLLVDLTDASVVSLLEYECEVRRVRWREDGRALEVVVSPYDEESSEQPFAHGFASVVERDDWQAVTHGSMSPKELTGPQVEAASGGDRALAQAARETLTALSAAQGVQWSRRRQVWAVEGLADGRVLAVLEGVKLESWLPSGELAWRLTDPDGARQLSVCPGGESAWVNVAPRPRWTGSGWANPPGTVERLSLADGSTLGTTRTAFPAALTTDLDGRIALRDTRHEKRPHPTMLLTPEHRESGSVDLGRYDVFNHYFPVRHSPELLFLQGGKKEYWKDKWVVAVDPHDHSGGRPKPRRLFPLSWDTDRIDHLYGGPALRLTGESGEALVHAGKIHTSRPLRHGHFFVVRRGYPDGALQWLFTTDHAVTALDTDGDTVFATLTSGEVVALDAASGTLQWRTHLTVDGIPTVALSLAVAERGHLLLGTVDGRILVADRQL